MDLLDEIHTFHLPLKFFIFDRNGIIEILGDYAIVRKCYYVTLIVTFKKLTIGSKGL